MSLTTTIVAQDKTYTEAVVRGDYDLYVGNLFGKYDNVRIYWEDQLTRMMLRPHIADLVKRKQRAGETVRILDLGCGAGQGLDVLTKIDRRDLDLGLQHERVLSAEDVSLYLGLDLSQAMVDKGNELFADYDTVRFQQADLRDGLAAVKAEEPFDIYFSSYGSFSHLSGEDLKGLLLDIAAHGKPGAIVVLDLLGRYSIEWPTYWTADPAADEQFRDYSMSYLQSEFGLDAGVDFFPMRFWTGAELAALVDEVSGTAAQTVKLREKFDRSIMVGRHVDTGEYNAALKPIRRAVNRLHEDYMRTDLSALLVDRRTFPRHPHQEADRFLNSLTKDWNALVKFCERRLKKNVATVELKGWSDYSPALQFAMMTIDRVINDTGWMWNGDPRANIIEPQLGYALRSLEMSLQQGLGCGHGLIAVLQVGPAA